MMQCRLFNRTRGVEGYGFTSEKIRTTVERAESKVQYRVTRKCIVRDSTECNAGSSEQL
jgi:hypothetical protein